MKVYVAPLFTIFMFHCGNAQDFEVSCASTKCKSTPKIKLVPANSLYGTKCCSDTALTGFVAAPSKCGSLFVSSPFVGGPCANHGTKTAAEALAFCADQGARLCTSTENLMDCTRAGKCGLNSLYIWSTGGEQPSAAPSIATSTMPTAGIDAPTLSSSPTSTSVSCASDEALVLVEILSEYNSEGISWELINFSTNEVVESRNKGFYKEYDTLYIEAVCVSTESCYQFHTHFEQSGCVGSSDINYDLSYDNIVVDIDSRNKYEVYNTTYDDDDDDNYEDNDEDDDDWDDDWFNNRPVRVEETKSAIMNGDKCLSSSPSTSFKPSSSPTSY